MSRLSELAKHLIEPDGAVATGWPRVRDTCNNLGWSFDQWQDDLGRLILAKRPDGLYAASLCALSLPRQVGKTYLMGCIAFALCLIEPGTTVIWTAHRSRTANETFRAMKAKAKMPSMAPFIDQKRGIRNSNGEQGIELLNGSRILFGAREAGFGVGFADVGVLVLDEIQRASVKAMDDLLPTTNAATNPLVLCIGTPPRPTDDGEVFTMLRTEAVEGESGDVLYVELGGTRFDLSDDDEFWRQLKRVNPAFPHRVGERAILRNKKGLTEDSVFRETFGVWDEFSKHKPVVKASHWEGLVDVGPEPDARPAALAVDMSHGREVSVSACWLEPYGAHVEEVWAGSDADAALDWIALRAGRRIPVVIDGMSPASSMIPDLKARRVQVTTTVAADMARACGLWLDEVNARKLTHAGQEAVDAALVTAKKRGIGTAGGWGWDRKDDSVNLAPLVAHTLARYGASLKQRKVQGMGRSGGERTTRQRNPRQSNRTGGGVT